MSETIYSRVFGETPVVEINSPRVQATDTKAAWDNCAIKYYNGTIQDVDITSSRDNIMEKLKGTNIMNHGGISNASSMFRQFYGANELTLQEFEKAMNSKQTLPFVFDYADAVKDSIIASGENNFETVHNYNLKNYLKMNIFEAQQISKTEESKVAGIQPLNWKLVDTSTRGGINEQTEISLLSQPAPYSSGFDPGLIYIGKSLWDETKMEITNVGGKGQATGAQDLGIYGISEIDIGGKKHTLEGINYLTEYGINAFNQAEEKGYSSVEIITQTLIENRIPSAIVPLHKIFIK
ncbi:MAG: hypothetical protein GQ477_02045 [Nanohaloarchaea archaeon]|nr:hypothetical protein [Candidatus Nanohaloarchaea archaeon]